MAIELLDTGPGVNLILNGLPPTITEFINAKMATVQLDWACGPQSTWPLFPAGTKIGSYKVQISGGDLTVPMTMMVAPPAMKAIFNNVPFDDTPSPPYTASVQLLATDGSPLGAAVTQTFTALSPVPVPVPNGLTVTVS